MFVGRAVLDAHRLCFTRRSDVRGCGVADVVVAPGEAVWGVLYEIDEGKDVEALNHAEGYRHGRHINAYTRGKVTVWQDGDASKPLTAETYFAERQESPPKPNAEYLGLIVAGARHWGLPDEYIGVLESIETED